MTEKTALSIREPLTELSPSKAEEIEGVFAPMIAGLKEFEARYEYVMAQEQTPEKSSEAKRLRLDIAKVRVAADKVRKAQKDQYLRAGNAIQGAYNILKDAVATKEEALKLVETYYERIEAEKIKRRQEERELELEQYGADGSTLDLGNMADDAYNILRTGYKATWDAAREAERKAEENRKIEAEKLALHNSRREVLAPYARFGSLERDNLQDLNDQEFTALLSEYEEQRIAEEAEQERIRRENEALKIQQEKDRIAREEAEAREAAEREKREAAERKAREEQEARDQAAREEQERIERERLEQEQREAAALREAEIAPDKQKLAKAAQTLLTVKDSLKSDEAKSAVDRAYTSLSNAAKKL